MKKLIPFLLLAAGCGDNNGGAVTPDGSTPDTPTDAPPFVAPTPVGVPLSATGTDQLLGAVPAPGGGFYAVGFRAATHEATADRELVLVKLDGMGALDTTFGGGDGIASLDVQDGGNAELFRGIVVQPGGKIVVSGIVEDELVAADRDIALVRFNSDGTVDTAFGGANTGIARLDLNVALTGMGPDFVWGLAQNATGQLFIHGAQRTETLDGTSADTLTDTDFVVVKLTVDGAVDTGWGDNGKFLLDIQRSSANARGLAVLADGSVIASGYAKSAGLGQTSEVQPVLYKLTPDGDLDTGFATGGLFHEVVLATMTEIYGIAIQPDGKIVTAGYGRATGDSNDWVSLRFTAAGELDTSWADDGKFVLDPSGMGVGDNNRHVINLDDGRVALIGSAGSPSSASDAYIAILDDTGKLDTAFGTGIMKFDMGGNDAMWGGALGGNGNRALFVGFKGGGATPSASVNDDAHVISLPLK